MSNSKYIFLSVMLTLAVSIAGKIVVAQDTTNTIGHVSIASPTAASLGKYGDIPVSYNTGIPNISVPIYTVQSGSLKLPISLSYHAGGLKVEESASWVGAGWSLNAGGVITRTVVGGPDDRGLQSINICYNGWYSDTGYSRYAFLYRPGVIGAAYDGYWPDDLTFCQGYKDAEPDLYFFNFCGYTGKFYFNDDRTPIFVPEEDFKVAPDLNNGTGGNGFEGFVVTTPDGMKYYFGRTGNDTTVNPIEITFPATIAHGPANANATVSSWYLNKIVSADGMDSINLTYAPESYSYFTLSMFPISNIFNSNDDLNPDNNQIGYNLVKNFINGVRLSGITFPNGRITFVKAASARSDLSGGYPTNTGMYDATNTDAYALGSININNTNGFCKKDSLYTSYWQDNTNTLNGQLANDGAYNITSDKYRLRLDSLQEISCDGTTKIPPYKFTYYSELVPRKLAFGIDHWGFYNGVTNNTCLIPSYTYTGGPAGATVPYFTGANRDAAWPAMRGGALQQITYPTGGYTRFAFQPNDTYVNYNTYTPSNPGGLSVGYDGSTQNSTTYTTIGANTIEVVLTSNLSSGTGNIEILDPGNNILHNYSAINGTDTFYCILSGATTYTLKLFKSSSLGTGYGVTASLREMVPTAVSGNATVGGLRIDSITNNDGLTGNNMVTTYGYTVSGGTQSSGILYSRPVYVQSIRNDLNGWINQPNIGTPGCIPTASTYYISPSSISPMSTVQGNHIGYNEVEVTQSGNGHSVYRYYGSSYWDNIISDVCTRSIDVSSCTTAIPNFPAPPLPFDPIRGELKYEGHYNENGQLLKDVTYTPVYANDPLTTTALSFINIPGLYAATGYTLQSAKKIQTSTVTTTYDPSTSSALTSTRIVYYGSNYHHQATREVSSTSTGDSLAINTKYVYDFRIGACDATPDSLQFYKDTINADTTHFFAGLGACSSGDWACRMDTLSNMRRKVALSRIKLGNYRLKYFTGANNFQDTCYAGNERNADTLLKPLLRLRDEFQNAPIEVSNWKDTNLLHANFTRYDTSTTPLGFAYPGRTKLINLQAPSGTFTPAAVSGSTIAKDSRYQDETFYQFASGNPQQVLGRDGLPNSYIWDYKNTEPIAKAVNATNDQIAYTSFEADGNGGWSIPSSTINSSSSITGAQEYWLTSTAITKSGLSSGTSYVVSYWSRTGSNFNIPSSTSIKQGKTIFMNSQYWTYFEHTVTGTTSISVNSTTGGGFIDELRLYPSNAQMTTYTYTPLVGMSSSCDVDNRVSYFFYDPLGRLRYIKDQDGNIIKTTEYHYAGQ